LVKAVDPIGTAYKMEDYFAAFGQTFEGLNNVFGKLAPLFPWLARYSIGFSITMILLEIVLGMMLIIGYRRKLTAWLLFLVLVFFTLLTGFTYLSGYVPSDVNFFDFAKWGTYIKTQMRVTDCGCFGDFIKLDPKISFFKDLVLLVPGFLFLIWSRNMHQLWTPRVRGIITASTTVITLLLCFQNTYMNLPIVDFRPFKIGTNIREQKALEAEARSNVQILGYKLENTNTGEKAEYMEPDPAKPYSVYKQYPKDQGWKVKDQIKNDPFIEKDGKRIPVTATKISEFEIESPDGEVTEDLLSEEGYSLMIVAYKLQGEKRTETMVVQDTTWAMDTLRISADSFQLQRAVASIAPQTIEKQVFIPTPDYADLFLNKINPLADAAQKAGWKVYTLITYQDAEVADSFKQQVKASYPFYKGDDKLLKTIIRANPGVVVLKNGQVLDMYHHRHLPTFEAVQAKLK